MKLKEYEAKNKVIQFNKELYDMYKDYELVRVQGPIKDYRKYLFFCKGYAFCIKNKQGVYIFINQGFSAPLNYFNENKTDFLTIKSPRINTNYNQLLNNRRNNEL
jgi:hypothetical protein